MMCPVLAVLILMFVVSLTSAGMLSSILELVSYQSASIWAIFRINMHSCPGPRPEPVTQQNVAEKY